MEAQYAREKAEMERPNLDAEWKAKLQTLRDYKQLHGHACPRRSDSESSSDVIRRASLFASQVRQDFKASTRASSTTRIPSFRRTLFVVSACTLKQPNSHDCLSIV